MLFFVCLIRPRCSFRGTTFALSVVKFLLSATTLFRVLDKTTMFFPWHHVFFPWLKNFCSQPRRSLVCLIRPRCSSRGTTFALSVVKCLLSVTTLFRVLDKTTMFSPWHHVCSGRDKKISSLLLSVTTLLLVLDKITIFHFCNHVCFSVATSFYILSATMLFVYLIRVHIRPRCSFRDTKSTLLW